MATGCGYTPAQTRALTLADVQAIYGAWRRNPPTHLLMASWLGLRSPAREEAARPMDAAALEAYMATHQIQPKVG